MKISLDSPIINKTDQAADVLAAGFLWLVCSIPIFTIGSAFAAFYYAVVKSVRKDRETVVKCFFHSFKNNLWQGTCLSVIYTLYGVFLIFYIIHGNAIQNFLGSMYLFWGIGIMLAAPFAFTIPYIFPVISRFEAGVFKQIQYALYMSVKHFFSTVLLQIMLAAVCVGIYIFPFFLLLLPGIYVYLSSFIIERILKKHIHESKVIFDGVEVPWYLE